MGVQRVCKFFFFWWGGGGCQVEGGQLHHFGLLFVFGRLCEQLSIIKCPSICLCHCFPPIFKHILQNMMFMKVFHVFPILYLLGMVVSLLVFA